ncbi:MAG TPA: NUDIX hydrolase [Candidatus Saccharimonadales bacterium]
MSPSSASKPLDKGVGVYIFSEDGTKVLMTQRGPGARHEQYRWEGPGGALDPGETYEEAAHREIMEELGIRIELGEVIGEYDHVTDSNGDAWEAKIFRATTREVPYIQEPEKCVGFGWFTREEVAQLSLADYAVKDLQKFGWL